MLNKAKAGIANVIFRGMSVEKKLVFLFLETSVKQVRPIVILPAVNACMKAIVGKLQKKAMHGLVTNGTLNGVEVSVIQTHVGGPGAAIIMEALKNCSCKAIIRVDFCGGLTTTQQDGHVIQTGIGIGSIVIPRSVFLSDGTSIQYLQTHATQVTGHPLLHAHPVDPGEHWQYPTLAGKYWAVEGSEKLHDVFQQLLPARHKRAGEDRVWSSDALFCESVDAINTWKVHGCNAVDMESCAVYLLGALFSIPVISVLAVSNLNDSEEFSLLNSHKIHPGMLQGLDDAVDLLGKGLPLVHRNFVQKT